MTTDGRDRMTQNYEVGTLYPMPILTIIVANRLPPTLHIGCRNILFNARDNVCFYIIICLFFCRCTSCYFSYVNQAFKSYYCVHRSYRQNNCVYVCYHYIRCIFCPLHSERHFDCVTKPQLIKLMKVYAPVILHCSFCTHFL